MTRLAGCIDRGLDVAREPLTQVRAYVRDLQAVDSTLRPNNEVTGREREVRFRLLQEAWQSSADPVYQHFAKMLSSFEPGLFGLLPTGTRENRLLMAYCPP